MTKKNKTILIVEDEQPLLQDLLTKFTKAGFQTLSAEDGETALTMALAEHPDLILLDIILPKLDGLAMLKKLRADKWGKKAAVIILTKLSDDQLIAEAMESGVYDFLVKSSWEIDDLIRRVRENLGLE